MSNQIIDNKQFLVDNYEQSVILALGINPLLLETRKINSHIYTGFHAMILSVICASLYP